MKTGKMRRIKSIFKQFLTEPEVSEVRQGAETARHRRWEKTGEDASRNEYLSIMVTRESFSRNSRNYIHKFQS